MRKTGGSYFRKHISKIIPDAKHKPGTSWHDTVEMILSEDEKKFIFGYVREPKSWYLSFFNHSLGDTKISSKDKQRLLKNNFITDYSAKLDFNEFIKNINSKEYNSSLIKKGKGSYSFGGNNLNIAQGILEGESFYTQLFIHQFYKDGNLGAHIYKIEELEKSILDLSKRFEYNISVEKIKSFIKQPKVNTSTIQRNISQKTMHIIKSNDELIWKYYRN